MKHHNVKIWPQFFAPLRDGTKTAELRAVDRDYSLGDYVTFQEWNPATRLYTGRECKRRISHILVGNVPGLVNGFALLSLNPIDESGPALRPGQLEPVQRAATNQQQRNPRGNRHDATEIRELRTALLLIRDVACGETQCKSVARVALSEATRKGIEG